MDRYYLLPHDFDRYEWRTTALSATDFNQALQSIKAKRLLVILDCCHAAGIGTAKDIAASLPLPEGVVANAVSKGFLDILKQGEGRVVFTSCRGEEKSWIRKDDTLSIYTHHLIEALQGAASQAGTTEVTIFDLANHLGKTVPDTTAAMYKKSQTPRFEMRDTEMFAIALLQGGKGLSSGGWKANQVNQPTTGSQTQISALGERSVVVLQVPLLSQEMEMSLGIRMLCSVGKPTSMLKDLWAILAINMLLRVIMSLAIK
jgi:hypothetical protein